MPQVPTMRPAGAGSEPSSWFGRLVARLPGDERLVMIMVSTVLVMAGQGVLVPVLPLFADQFSVSIATVGLTLSVFAFARLLVNVPGGLLADRYGRRYLLVGGPLVTAVGMVGSGLSNSIAHLLVWRFVAGAGSALYMTGTQTYLADISTPLTRARVIGSNQAALLLGVTLGPGLGGLLADRFGYRVPFHVVGAWALLAGVYAFIRLPETRVLDSDAPAVRLRTGARQLFTNRDFVAVSAVTGVVFLSRGGGRFTLLPLFADERFGYGAAAIGALFTAMSLVNLLGITPASMIADRYGRKRAIVPSGLAMGLSFLALAAADTNAAFLGALLVMAVATSVVGPAPAAYSVDVSPDNLRGLAIGLHRSAGDLGFLAGPVLLGALADGSSLAWALALDGLIVLVVIALFGLLARETVVHDG